MKINVLSGEVRAHVWQKSNAQHSHQYLENNTALVKRPMPVVSQTKVILLHPGQDEIVSVIETSSANLCAGPLLSKWSAGQGAPDSYLSDMLRAANFQRSFLERAARLTDAKH